MSLRVIVVVSLCIALAFQAGCQLSVPVDHDNDPATPDRQMDDAALERWEAAEAKRSDAKVAAAKAEAAKTLAAIGRSVQRQLREAEQAGENAIAKIRDFEASSVAETDAVFTAAYTDASLRFAQVGETAAAARAALDAKYAGLESFARIVQSPEVASIAGAVPGGSLALGLLAPVAAWFVARGSERRTQRKADEAWDEASGAKKAAENEALVKQLLAMLQPALAQQALVGAVPPTVIVAAPAASQPGVAA